MVEPFSEIGMIAQVTAIQPVMDQPSRPSCGTFTGPARQDVRRPGGLTKRSIG